MEKVLGMEKDEKAEMLRIEWEEREKVKEI
jgi:hypothetical protein